MSEGTTLGIAGILALLLFALAAVFLTSRTCDSIDNCARSCGWQMVKYTETPVIGSSTKSPTCECAPADQQ